MGAASSVWGVWCGVVRVPFFRSPAREPQAKTEAAADDEIEYGFANVGRGPGGGPCLTNFQTGVRRRLRVEDGTVMRQGQAGDASVPGPPPLSTVVCALFSPAAIRVDAVPGHPTAPPAGPQPRRDHLQGRS